MMYAAAAKTGFVRVPEPETLNVPFAIVRKPAVFAPWTVIVPPGRKSSIEAALVPLFRLIVRRSSVPELFSEALAAPVNVIEAPAVSVFVLRSIVPAFTRFAPTERMWPVCVPVTADCSVPPASTVTFAPTASVRAVVSSYWSVPPVETLTLSAAAAVSIVTVQPLPIITSSAAVGTTPSVHVAGELQLPPGAAHVISVCGDSAPLPASRPSRRSRPLGSAG